MRLGFSANRFFSKWSVVVSIAVAVTILVSCGYKPISIKDGSDGLVVELWASNECPRTGDTVTIRATLINQRAQPLRVDLVDHPVLDIAIGNPDTTNIRWSSGKSLTPEITQLELQPGESKTIEMQYRIDNTTSFVVISALFIADPDSIKDPIQPLSVLHVGSCPGLFGP